MDATSIAPDREAQVREVARASQGASAAWLIAWAAATIRGWQPARLVDIGCGRGDLARALAVPPPEYTGVDIDSYGGLEQRAGVRFVAADLNQTPYPLADDSADVVAAVETIEHLENPRALAREMKRIARPGGWLLLTTPNQLSWLSKATLLGRHEFNAFQERPGLYPTHITALLESDLRHIAAECGLVEIAIAYSGQGRMPGSARPWPGWLRRRFPRGCSDNVMLVARKPGG